MASTSFNRGSLEPSGAPESEIECLGLAVNLLQEMFGGLLLLARDNATLARALRQRGPEALERLSTLQEAVELLMELDGRSMALPLRRPAAALIAWLSGEIDELMLCAASDGATTCA